MFPLDMLAAICNTAALVESTKSVSMPAGIGLGPSDATRLIVVHGAAGWGGAGKVIGDFVFINNLLFSRLNSTRHTRHTTKWIKFIFQFNPSYRDCYWWM